MALSYLTIVALFKKSERMITSFALNKGAIHTKPIGEFPTLVLFLKQKIPDIFLKICDFKLVL